MRGSSSSSAITASGGNEISLTRDLAVTKVVRQGRTVYDLMVPPRWPWPLAAGKFSRSRATVTTPPDGVRVRVDASSDAQVTSSVIAVEEITTRAGRFHAFKVVEDWTSGTINTGLQWRTT